VVNTAPIPEERLSLYQSKAACPVEIDMRRLMAMGVQVLARPLLAQGEKVRHDPDLTAEVAMDLARRSRRRALRAQAQAV